MTQETTREVVVSAYAGILLTLASYPRSVLPIQEFVLSLYFFLVVIVSLGCGTLPPLDIPLTSPILATLMMVVAWWLLTHVGVRMIATQAIAGKMSPLEAVTLMEKQLNAFRWLGLPVVLLCLGGFGLGRVLDNVPVLDDWMALRALVLLLPGVAITASTWSAENYYGMLVGYTTKSWRAHIKSTSAAVRMGVAWLVMPVLVLMLMMDLAGMLFDESKFAAWVLPTCVLIVVPLGLPLLIRFLFKTQRLNAGDEAWMRELLHAVKIRGTRVLRWDTGGATFNAMVAGFVPPLRTLLVSDRVLDDLPKDQIAMVVLHEAAHLRRKHVPIRMLTVLPAWGAGVLVTQIASSSDYAMPLGTVAGILLTILILRIVSYRTEFDADVQACKMAVQISGQIDGIPMTMIDATETLGAALNRISFDHPEITKSTWLHPSLSDRLECLRKSRQPSQHATMSASAIHPV